MAQPVTMFRVYAMRYDGPSATKRGWSDKIWVGVILSRADGAGNIHRFVAVYGPTGGTFQHKAQPWERATQAEERYENMRREKEFEGYQPVEWRNLVGMESYLRALPERMADPVASGDTARKAWQTRKRMNQAPAGRPAEEVANEMLANVNLEVLPKPTKPKPAEPAPAEPGPTIRMRSVRREMKDLLDD